MCTVAALRAPSPLSPLRTSTLLLLRRLSFGYKWNTTSMPGRFITWCRRLGQINWRKTFLFMYRYHMDKRITDIQYKNIHGKIALRLTLFRPGIQDSCLCPRCHTTPKELVHISLDCLLSCYTQLTMCGCRRSNMSFLNIKDPEESKWSILNILMPSRTHPRPTTHCHSGPSFLQSTSNTNPSYQFSAQMEHVDP